MAIFTLCVMAGIGGGAIVGGWIEMNPHLGWRWTQWIQMMYALVLPVPDNFLTIEQILLHLSPPHPFQERNTVRSAPRSPR